MAVYVLRNNDDPRKYLGSSDGSYRFLALGHAFMFDEDQASTMLNREHHYRCHRVPIEDAQRDEAAGYPGAAPAPTLIRHTKPASVERWEVKREELRGIVVWHVGTDVVLSVEDEGGFVMNGRELDDLITALTEARAQLAQMKGAT